MRILVFITDNGLLYVYKADTIEEKDEAVRNYISSNSVTEMFEEETGKPLADPGAYSRFTGSYTSNYCENYELEQVMEPLGK